YCLSRRDLFPILSLPKKEGILATLLPQFLHAVVPIDVKPLALQRFFRQCVMPYLRLGDISLVPNRHSLSWGAGQFYCSQYYCRCIIAGKKVGYIVEPA